MSKERSWERCPDCGKRGWRDERHARKVLGRAQSRRNRLADKAGTRRGMRRENRVYDDCSSGLFHMASMSRREVYR